MKLSKKLLSILLAMLMVMSIFPSFALSASAAAESTTNTNFLFAYFTGNGNVTASSSNSQAVRFAISSDNAKTFNILNNNNRTIVQKKGTLNSRDPYIFKGQDGYYYAICTDMDASGGWWGNSNSMVIWRSKDLVNWVDETIINLAEIIGKDVYRCWAPQVIWDSSKNEYMVYLAVAANGYSAGGTKMHYMHTSDLLDQSKYSMPQPMMKNNNVASRDSIDGDITEENGKYYLFFKDEGNGTICIATSNSIEGEYDTDNLVVLNAGTSIGALEGCQVFKDYNGDYIFFADRYSKNGNFAVYNLGKSLSNFVSKANGGSIDISSYYDANVSNSISQCGPRHGSMLAISQSEYNTLANAIFNGAVISGDEGIDLSENLVGQYLIGSDVTKDYSSNNYNFTENTGVVWNNTAYSSSFGAADFSAGKYLVSSHFKDMIQNSSNEQGFSISFYANRKSSATNDESTLGRFVELNNKGGNAWSWTSGGSGYAYLTYYNYNAIESCQIGWGNGGKTKGAEQEKDSWHLYTITYANGVATSYVDGAKDEYANTASVYDDLSYLLVGATGFKNDINGTFCGYMRDLRVFDKALSEEEAGKLAVQYDIETNSQMAQAKAFAENLNAKTGTAKGKYMSTDIDASLYSNLLYNSQSSISWSDDIWNPKTDVQTADGVRINTVLNSENVLLYDGTGNVYFPFRLEAYVNGNTSVNFMFGEINDANYTLKSNWGGVGNGDEWNKWSHTGYSSDSMGYSSESSQKSANTYKKSAHPFWYNKVYLSDSFSFSKDEYVKTIDGISLTVGTSSNGGATTNTATKKYVGSGYNIATVRVINYKPIYDAIPQIKATANNLKDESAYCEDSLNDYVTALEKVASFDPNSYFTNSNDYNGCANAIKDICDNYLELAINGPTKHVKATKKENEVKATGLAGGSYDEVVYCSVCNEEFSRTQKTTDKLDTSAYEAALEEAEALAQSKKYTAESREIYASAVEDAKINLGEVTDFADIERATEAILACKSNLVVAGYTVDFVVKYSDGTEDVNVDYGVVDYGTLQTFDATDYLNGGTITKWVIDAKDGKATIPTNDSSIQVAITEDTVVTVSISVVPAKEETAYHAIKVANASGRVVDVKYVADGASFDLNTLTKESIPFYDFKEWYVHNDADLTNVTTDIVISPVYTPIDDKCIYINGVDGVTVKGKNSANEDTSGTRIKVPYDSLVTINGSAKYAFCNETGDVIYSYITGNKIHAPKNNKNVYIKVVTEAKASTTVTGSFVLPRDGGKKGASYNCQFYLPEGATFVECGAIATKESDIATGENFEIGTANVFKIVSKSQSKYNEYTCTFISTYNGVSALYGRSYLTYKEGDETKTIYSAVEEININL